MTTDPSSDPKPPTESGPLDKLADIDFNREAVAVFDDVAALETAIDALRMAGISRAQISLLAETDVVSEKLGSSFWTSKNLEDDPDAPRVDYVSQESLGAAEGGAVGALVYIGAVASAIATATAPILVAVSAVGLGATAGALIGGALARILGEDHADYLTRQIRRGGLVLWVRVFTPEQEARALEILRQASGRDVHVHGRLQDAASE